MATVMKSILVAESNHSIKLDTPLPVLRAGDVMIKVHAAGVNRLDLLQAEGRYPPPPGESDILGVEVSGTITMVTDEAAAKSGLKKGDKVFSLLGGGGYAEYCRAPYQTVMKMPDGVSFEEAAGIAEAYMTAYSGLFWSGHLEDNETVLVHAAGGAVGQAAIQLAKSLRKNVRVCATAGSKAKLDMCAKLGADVCINYKTEDFVTKVMSETEEKGVNVILDFIGASNWEKHMKCVATDGRLVLLGLLGGTIVKSQLDLRLLLIKRIQIIPSTLRSRSMEYKYKLAQELTSSVLPLFLSKELKVCVDSTIGAVHSGAAHKRMRNNLNIGKVIITFL